MNSSFPASIQELHSILQWVRGQLAGLDRTAIGRVELATEEALVNIINYAKVEQIDVEVKNLHDGRIEIAIKDQGPPFNPLKHKGPDLVSPLEERNEGGLGIYFIRECMDEVRYFRDRHTNTLVLVKRY